MFDNKSAIRIIGEKKTQPTESAVVFGCLEKWSSFGRLWNCCSPSDLNSTSPCLYVLATNPTAWETPMNDGLHGPIVKPLEQLLTIGIEYQPVAMNLERDKPPLSIIINHDQEGLTIVKHCYQLFVIDYSQQGVPGIPHICCSFGD